MRTPRAVILKTFALCLGLLLAFATTGCMAMTLNWLYGEDDDATTAQAEVEAATEQHETQIFPFTIVYELGGETITIEDAVVVSYNTTDEALQSPDGTGTWIAGLESGGFDIFRIILEFEGASSPVETNRENFRSDLYFDFGTADYYLGIAGEHNIPPQIIYLESYADSPGVISQEETVLSPEQVEEYFGLRIIAWEFSEPNPAD